MTITPQKSILLVEDEVIIGMMNKIALEKYGYTVKSVTSGEEAIATIERSSDISLILMDIDLGEGIDGTQAAEQILSTHDIPVVFLSSHSEPEVVEKTEKITSYGYVVKNSSITVLDASIKMAFKLFNAKMNELKKEFLLKKREEELQESQRIAKVGSWRFDLESNIVVWSDELYRIYGLDSTLPPLPFPEHKQFYKQTSWNLLSDALHNIMQNGLPFDLELETVWKDGSHGWLWVYGKTVCDENGKTTELMGTVQDITNRKLAEIALQTKNEEYEALNEELRSSVEELQATTEELRLTTQELQTQNRELRISENILRRKKEELQETQRIAKVGSWYLDIATNESVWSEELYIISGVDPASPPPRVSEYQDGFTPDSFNRLVSATAICAEKGIPFEHELETVLPDGRHGWIKAHGNPVRDTSGKIIGIKGVVQDITGQIKTEMALRKNETE